jgi:heptosyltransferase II
MKNGVKNFIRTFFRYLYFRMVRVFDLVLNSHKPPFPLEATHSILFVEVQDIGDTIIASPCIRQIRKRFPNATIHMLVQNKSIDMVKYNPNLDSAFGVSHITSYIQLFRVAREYRKKHYDLVISLSPSVRNNLIATLSAAKIISGYLNDFHFLPTNYHDHPIEVRGFRPPRDTTYYREEPLRIRALKAAAPFGIDLGDYVDTELFLPEESRQFADRFLKDHAVQPQHILVGLHPVCLNDFRNWPPDRFAHLGNRLVELNRDVRIFLIGIKEDEETLRLIVSRMKHRDHVLCDTSLSLLQTASVIDRCDVLVGMDSCPSDIAGALKIPTVHMHGPTDPRVTGPGGVKNYPVTQGLPCSPCGLNIHVCPLDKQCMRQLEVSKVLEATLHAIGQYRSGKMSHV